MMWCTGQSVCCHHPDTNTCLSPFSALGPRGAATGMLAQPHQPDMSFWLPGNKVQHILKFRAWGQTRPVSSHAFLKRTGLRGHRFQSLDGRDDSLFPEEGKESREKERCIHHHFPFRYSGSTTFSWPEMPVGEACNVYVYVQNSPCKYPAISVRC